MPKPDRAHQWTDEELERLERRISRVYREAWDDLEKTVIDYFNRFVVRDEEMRKLIGTEINGKVWTEHDYELWRLNQIGRGERFGDLAVKVAERYTKANEVALAYVNDTTPGIYTLNRNYAAYTEGGRPTPWTYQDDEGNWHWTAGNPAQPFLKPAVADHAQTYRNIIEDEIKNG